jgi:hypothetical protein
MLLRIGEPAGAEAWRFQVTKAGKAQVRRLLIESAWHHRKSYSTCGPTLRARWAKVDPALRARVNGHVVLPTDGQEISSLVAMSTPHGRTWDLPG